MEFMVLNAPTAVGASTIIAILYFIYNLFLKPKSHLANLPTLGQPSDPYLQDLLIEGSKKACDQMTDPLTSTSPHNAQYPDSPYTIPEVLHEPNTLILPKKYIDEVKSIPETVLSLNRSVYARYGGKYTTLGELGTHNHVMIESIKLDLTRNIARTLEGLQDEADYAIPSCIGDFEDWTPIQFYPKILRVIALLSGRIFVGLPLCRDEAWIEATINYTMDAFAAIQPVKKISPLLRPFKAPWIPEVQRIKQHRDNGARLLKPILEKRFSDMRSPDFKPPADMIQFVIQHSGAKAEDAMFQSFVQMVTSLAAIHTTAMNITHIIYNLAIYPEYQGPLRRELQEVLRADNGILIKSNMTKLKKMDSFIKESQRMAPPNACSSALQSLPQQP